VQIEFWVTLALVSIGCRGLDCTDPSLTCWTTDLTASIALAQWRGVSRLEAELGDQYACLLQFLPPLLSFRGQKASAPARLCPLHPSTLARLSPALPHLPCASAGVQFVLLSSLTLRCLCLAVLLFVFFAVRLGHDRYSRCRPHRPERATFQSLGCLSGEALVRSRHASRPVSGMRPESEIPTDQQTCGMRRTR
jgi:hypothetical protein